MENEFNEIPKTGTGVILGSVEYDYSSGITITNGTSMVPASSGTIYSNQGWVNYIPPSEIQIGKCTLKEVDGELHWVYPDGTSTVLTGKGKNFNDLYNLMNEPEDTTR